MAFEHTGITKYLTRAAAISIVAFGASACSMMPSWLGGDRDSAPAMTADDQADAQDAANTPSPDLSTVPDKPAPPSTADDQKALSTSLGTDRAKNQYSSDQLRGGTEAAAPPGASPPPDQVAQTGAAASPPEAAPPPDTSAPPPDSGAAPAGDQSAPTPVPPAPAATTADDSAPAASPPAAPAEQQTAAAVPPPAATSSSSMPAVPANSYGSYGMVDPSDAALGFRPSTAPPLDPTVAQFVPRPIIARYQQTAAAGRAEGVGSAYSATPVSNSSRGMGGPEKMSGAVVADFDSINGGGSIPSYSYGADGAPSATVMFAGDTTILNAGAREQVRAAAAAFQQGGSAGYVRVVGHSSSGKSSLSSERQMAWNLERSQARATAVARELIKDGVPAGKVLVEGSGDQTGRSADIFLQS
jgi:outer membrane protein OmpA-like peptidoglycan-associated protein